MDPNGARHLRRRIESHEHWQQAAAVQAGEQSAADPDAHDLVHFAGGLRTYRDGSSKQLVGGRWVVADQQDATS